MVPLTGRRNDRGAVLGGGFDSRVGRSDGPWVTILCRMTLSRGGDAFPRHLATELLKKFGTNRQNAYRWGCFRPRPCENVKLLGFRVSLYPSRGTAKPIRRDLKGRFFRAPRSAYVFTRPRPGAAARLAGHRMTATEVLRTSEVRPAKLSPFGRQRSARALQYNRMMLLQSPDKA